MANVNDGSVVWSLNKINNAEQLNGLTAEQIKNNAINGYTVKGVTFVVGTLNLTVTSYERLTGQIPLPSGYTDRSKCKAYISNFTYNHNYEGTTNVTWENLDQSTQSLSLYVKNGQGTSSKNVKYILWCWK